ncbi:MAG: hypothetical protein ABI844_08200 [Saprospiraceae bacterium]
MKGDALVIADPSKNATPLLRTVFKAGYGDKNKRTVFYFDRIYVSECCVEGVESRFIQSIRKAIPLKGIKKIEVQDGKKNFHYVNNH